MQAKKAYGSLGLEKFEIDWSRQNSLDIGQMAKIP